MSNKTTIVSYYEKFELIKEVIEEAIGNIAIFKAMNDTFGDKSNYIQVHQSNNSALIATIRFCNSYGADSEDNHWKKFFDDNRVIEEIRKEVIYKTFRTTDEWQNFYDDIKLFRDHYVVHHNYFTIDKSIKVPDFNIIISLFDMISPKQTNKIIKREKDKINNKCMMIAGYTYEWVSEKNPNGDDYDIVLEDGFKAKWNFANSIWAIDPDSFDQVGCIHTSQGLEFDYCGIIIGRDLRYVNGHVITDQTKEAESDHSSGIRNCKDKKLADELIRNTYKTLLSRGQKGCFIYCEDKELREYIKRTK